MFVALPSANGRHNEDDEARGDGHHADLKAYAATRDGAEVTKGDGVVGHLTSRALDGGIHALPCDDPEGEREDAHGHRCGSGFARVA